MIRKNKDKVTVRKCLSFRAKISKSIWWNVSISKGILLIFPFNVTLQAKNVQICYLQSFRKLSNTNSNIVISEV